VIHGLYDKYKVEEAADDRERKRRLHRARKDARKIILKSSPASGAKEKAKVERGFRGKPKSIATVSDLEYATFIPPVGLEYLEKRGITGESIAQWELGWDEDEKRIVIPAHDANGHLRFLIKRAVNEKRQWPKYLYTEGFPKTSLLFGACFIDPRMIRSSGLILVEGAFAVIWLRQLGFHNACAILGTGISLKQVEILARWRPRRIYLMFDKDTAGVANIQIATKRLRKYSLQVCRYPKAKSEADGLTRREADRVIERAMPISKFFARFPNVRPKEGIYIG
jgi:DNA primase